MIGAEAPVSSEAPETEDLTDDRRNKPGEEVPMGRHTHHLPQLR